MAEISKIPDSEAPEVTPSHEMLKYIGTSTVFSVVVGTAFFIGQGYQNPQSNWANHFGNALACGLLSLGTAAIILIFVLRFPRNRIEVQLFFRKLAIPMILTGAFWLWRTDVISQKEAGKGRYEKLVKETISKQQLQKQEADPIIRLAKIKLDEDIKRFLSKTEGSLQILGWSVSPIGGGTWLVKFEFSTSGRNRWLLYEYNDYLGDFKSIFSDDEIRKQYLDSDSDGSSFNEDTRLKMGGWYGPIR